ncbi:biotin--[acetyl-CoA-carboxylase] ligase [Pelagibacteraceae bacterium]|nr:biotin--[acetyl-CoA-carboxylase] ligase [Pelagibacteraceae bacterium]
MKFNIFKYDIVSSTNNVAADLIKNQKNEFGFVFADKQTKGKGTFGKKWISQKGNFFASIFFPLKKNFPPFNEFSIINSILVSDVIKHFCRKDKVSLKFPNDIFLNGKKVCGILQELITLKDKKYLIIGIGLNIIDNPVIIGKYKATNIFFETKKKIKIDEIIKQINVSYEKFFINLNLYNYINFKKKAELMAAT